MQLLADSFCSPLNRRDGRQQNPPGLGTATELQLDINSTFRYPQHWFAAGYTDGGLVGQDD